MQSELTIEQIEQLLTSHGIDLSLWGVGATKTPRHILNEVSEGECLLKVENGVLIREINVASATIYFESSSGIRFVLKETKQVYKNGSEKKRSNAGSVSEKLKSDEDPEAAMVRGIKEELGIEGSFSIEKLETNVEEKYSSAYPGLLCRYNVYNFKVDFPEELYNPDGYMEVQEDKTTYFNWLKM